MDVQPEKVATAPSKEPIAEEQEEEGDATTVESAAEDPVADEAENAELENEESLAVETKELDSPTAEEKTENKQSPFVCCEGDVLKNLQAAVGLAV